MLGANGLHLTELTEEDVLRLRNSAPFSAMDEGKFSKRAPLRDILANDTRLRRYRRGEIITRRDDYGTSAFLILKGSVRVVLELDLPASLLGRRPANKKGGRIMGSDQHFLEMLT